MMRRLAGTFLSLTAAGAFMTGCSSTPEQPPLTSPNGTLEQVAHNAGYADTLGRLTLHQSATFRVAGGDEVILYNFTPTDVPVDSLKEAANYYTKLGSQGTNRIVTLYPHSNNTPVATELLETTKPAAEHDIILVPEGTPLPASFHAGDSNAATLTLEAQAQTISVVQQTSANGSPQPFEKSPNTDVEECQAFIYETVLAPTSTDRVQAAIEQRLAQETICNNVGRAVLGASQGMPYDKFAQDAAGYTGYLKHNNHSYRVGSYVVTPQEYADMPVPVPAK